MNPLENRLQSWTPRRPSPKIARRLFGPAENPSLPAPRRGNAWNWLSPVAACALTMLVAVHAANHTPGRLAQGSNATFFATLMIDAAASSNIATFTLSEMDENLEWNIWHHPTHHVAAPLRAETPLRRRDIWSLIPTNY
ncbi:MAG TPA: hypothetical protein VK731_01365 [Candidatus Cybelea sp.]|nr:hypothetical protein [Candidatus Cybelea sp.]